MRGLLQAALAMLLLISFLPQPAGAQTPFYFTPTAAAGPGGDLAACGAKAYAFSAALPADGKAYHGQSSTGLACTAYFVHDTTQAFQLSGDASVHFWTACDTPVVVGTPATVAYRVQLKKGSTTITQKDASGGFSPCTGTSTVTEVKVEGIATKDESFAPGDKLIVALIVWTSGVSDAARPSFHYLVGPSRPSALFANGLPGGSVDVDLGPRLVTGNLTGDTAVIEESFANATSEVHQFSWQTDLRSAQVQLNASRTAGNATLLVLDGNNTAVVNQTLASNETIQLPSVAPGNWSIRIDYAGYAGSVLVRIGAPGTVGSNSTAGPGGTPSSASSTATGSRTNSTGQDGNATATSGASDEDAPGPSAVLAMMLIAVAALVARRRRT